MVDLEASVGPRLDGIGKNLDAIRAEMDAQAYVRDLVRGRKIIRLPIMYGTPASSAVAFGGHNSGNALATPEQGFIWNVRLLVINGMTTGSTPDVIDIKINGQRVWQLNGNQFAQTWSIGEMVLFPGEAFRYESNGTFAATGTNAITALGFAVEVPAEMQGKIF